MVEREGVDLQRPGMVDLLRRLHRHGNVTDLERDAVAVVGEEEFEYRAEPHRGVDVQRGHPGEHPHRGEQAEESEDMVAVDVGDEDRVNLHRRDTALLETGLCPLSAIY